MTDPLLRLALLAVGMHVALRVFRQSRWRVWTGVMLICLALVAIDGDPMAALLAAFTVFIDRRARREFADTPSGRGRPALVDHTPEYVRLDSHGRDLLHAHRVGDLLGWDAEAVAVPEALNAPYPAGKSRRAFLTRAGAIRWLRRQHRLAERDRALTDQADGT